MMMTEKMWIHWLHVLFSVFFIVHIFRFGFVTRSPLLLWGPLSRYRRHLHATASNSTQNVLLFTTLSVCSSKHRVFYLDQVHLTTPEWFFHPYMLQIPYARSFIFLSPVCWLSFLRTLFLRARVTQAMLSQLGSQREGSRVKVESITVREEWCQAK